MLLFPNCSKFWTKLIMIQACKRKYKCNLDKMKQKSLVKIADLKNWPCILSEQMICKKDLKLFTYSKNNSTMWTSLACITSHSTQYITQSTTIVVSQYLQQQNIMNYATLLVTVDNVSQNQLHYCIFYATLSTELINKITKTKNCTKFAALIQKN